MSRAHLRRRIAALDRLINPPNSIGAKLAKLTNEQRETYFEWRGRCATYCSVNQDGEAYAKLLDGESPPMLRDDIRAELFGPTVTIRADLREGEAAEIYRSFACRGPAPCT